ncbi:MAG: thioesterase family protein [Myxococcales bacterium]|nr:thioesterase family protein [Myxococcales bacterium]
MTKEQLIEAITLYFNENIPFNKLVGILVEEVSVEQVVLRFPMKPELIGNTFMGILHGGVTSTVLDVAGGLVAMINAIDRVFQSDPAMIQEKMRKIGTIDLRVDYLRPGYGEEFFASATVIRHGKKIAVTRMELRNEKNEQIALGTATYLVG